MKFMIVFLSLFLIACNGNEKKDAAAVDAWKEGYVFTDAYYIIHWNESCNKAPKKTMLIKHFSFFEDRDVNFCSCVPIPRMKEIEKQIDYMKTKYSRRN